MSVQENGWLMKRNIKQGLFVCNQINFKNAEQRREKSDEEITLSIEFLCIFALSGWTAANQQISHKTCASNQGIEFANSHCDFVAVYNNEIIINHM